MATTGVLVTGTTCGDCGPYCHHNCAEHRNGHPVTVRPTSANELRDMGFDAVCRNCGASLFDDENE